MNKTEAKKISEFITNEDLLKMFVLAKNSITDWTKTSICNKGCSKGVAWNILASDFDINTEYSKMAKINMIREFGEYLPVTFKSVKKPSRILWNIQHAEPNFNSYK